MQQCHWLTIAVQWEIIGMLTAPNLCNNLILVPPPHSQSVGGRRSPAVACWASDHWVASSNPLRGKFRN